MESKEEFVVIPILIKFFFVPARTCSFPSPFLNQHWFFSFSLSLCCCAPDFLMPVSLVNYAWNLIVCFFFSWDYDIWMMLCVVWAGEKINRCWIHRHDLCAIWSMAVRLITIKLVQWSASSNLIELAFSNSDESRNHRNDLPWNAFNSIEKKKKTFHFSTVFCVYKNLSEPLKDDFFSKNHAYLKRKQTTACFYGRYFHLICTFKYLIWHLNENCAFLT